MPKLLIFAACEQVITDLNNTVSLMKLVQEVTAQVPAGVTPPPNTGSMMQWSILSIFEREPADQGKQFETYTAFISSTGDIIFQTPITVFEMKADQHRITNQINGMPVGRVGTHRVKCFLREKGGSHVWAERGSYPIKIQWATSLILKPN
jgi:hypothetical protein